MRILIFGDSIAQGYYDLDSGGWANMLFIDNMKRKVRRIDNSTEIFNISISGDTTAGVTACLAAEIESRLWSNEPVLLLFAIGFNDTRLENGKPVLTPEQYREQLKKLYDIAKKYSQRVAFVGLPSVDETESIPWIFNIGNSELTWTNERIKRFNEALETFTQEEGVVYIPIFNTFLERQQKGAPLHADGIHPNENGHTLIYSLVKLSLSKLLLAT